MLFVCILFWTVPDVISAFQFSFNMNLFSVVKKRSVLCLVLIGLAFSESQTCSNRHHPDLNILCWSTLWSFPKCFSKYICPSIMCLVITSVNHSFLSVAFGLYFPRKEYHENVYIDQPAGTPLLRIHALKDSEEEEVHFGVCSDLFIQRDGIHKNLWFQIQENTGLLFLSRSLEKDLDKICKSHQ